MSDNELDAELLALAGDDSSDDERSDNRQAQPSSPFEHAALSSEPDRSPPRRSLAQKPKSRSSAASAPRRRRKDDSEEEGEASAASSPRSLGSAAMDESDSEDGVDFDQEAPLYPIEGKFRSEADRAEVMAMTEIRREEILAERAAEVERRVQDLQLKKILQQRKREQAGADKRKRKAAAANLDDDDQRKSSRPKVKASGPLEAYKREREMKGQQRNRGDERRRDRSPSRDDMDSDRDAEGDSEVEWDEKPRAAAAAAARDDAPAALRDFERARIGRTNFARVCFYPTFETSVRNCYARVSIGVNRDTGAPQYRMAQIKSFTSGKPYQMEGLNGKPFVTDQYAVVAHGKAEKEWPFIACSDSSFTEAEFERFKAAQSADSLRLPSKKALVAKLDDIHSLLEYQWTDEDIQRKINRTNALQAKFANYGREKIEKRREEAASRGDDTTVAKCDAELAALGSGSGAAKAAQAAANAAKQNGKLAQQERLAALNRANRKANSEDVRKAQLAEKRVLQKAREEAAAKARREAEAAKEKLLAVPDDLFGDASDISRTGTPANGTSGTSTPINEKLKKTTLGGFKKKPKDEDIIADMDLGIDIDI
ncbi:hypothetical protein M436DRAFT_60324 [Aureobasidium namibiae CBS 147.97]|uniref:Plus3 domain-containing protein n=1 Tax=Aureobasidium namibiae CBS 147.97 TaxID=1043004 RepID=A0A074XPH7_9PEZI